MDDVKLDNESAKLFGADWRGGKVVLTALPGATLKAKTKYDVTMQFVLVEDASGERVTVSKKVTVTPVNKLPKVKVSTSGCNLYKTNLEKEIRYKLGMDGGYVINRVEVEPDKKGVEKYFTVTLNADDTVSVKLDRTDIKAGTYSLSCKVIIHEADNSKPLKIKLKAVVR